MNETLDVPRTTTQLPLGATQSLAERLPSRPVVVGVDGSAESDLAVEWAAREALSRGVPLQVLRTYGWPPVQPWSTGSDASIVAAMRADSERIAYRALGIAHERVPGVDVEELVVSGQAADSMIAAGRRAGLLVLGSRHLNLMQRIFAGVSGPVSARAECPVVVVDGPEESTAPDAGVVVGVAGRPGDADALAFAFEHAARHRLPLRPVLCWHHDALAAAQWRNEPPAPECAARLLAETLAGWRENYPDVQVHAGVQRDRPIAGLVAASTAQALLVVGREPHRLSHRAILGSVAQGVLHHATCPVAIVPTR